MAELDLSNIRIEGIGETIWEFLPDAVKMLFRSADDYFSADDRTKLAATEELAKKYEEGLANWKRAAIMALLVAAVLVFFFVFRLLR